MPSSLGLREQQHRSLRAFHRSLLDFGWERSSLRILPDVGIASTGSPHGDQLVFDQKAEDKRVREIFSACRRHLPDRCRIQRLSLDHVGALALAELRAFCAITADENDEFIAISFGIRKLRYWAVAVTNATTDGEEQPGVVNPEIAEMQTPESWKAAILPLAADILGVALDAKLLAKLVGWDMATKPSADHTGLRALMECFAVYHEIGHFELDHGGEIRALCEVDKEPSTRLNHLHEWEADQFACLHTLDIANSLKSASVAISVIFALFALHPQFYNQYPRCPHGSTHPHPLTRLFWILRKLHQDDEDAYYPYIWFTLSILQLALESQGEEHSEKLKMLIHHYISKEDPPSR